MLLNHVFHHSFYFVNLVDIALIRDVNQMISERKSLISDIQIFLILVNFKLYAKIYLYKKYVFLSWNKPFLG